MPTACQSSSIILGHYRGRKIQQIALKRWSAWYESVPHHRESSPLPEKHLSTATFPDNDSQAAVYLQLASLEIQRNQNKVGKEYFRRAKALKPKAAEIVDQLKQMEKHVARIPG